MSGNLPSVDVLNDSSTTTYFNNYFNKAIGTSPELDDAVISYFEGITGKKESAKVLAGTVMYTALSRGIDLAELLDQFRQLEPGELNSYLSLFLNLDRVGTSLLGVSNEPQLSKYVARTILP